MERREFLKASINFSTLTLLYLAGFGCKPTTPVSAIKLPDLPYDKKALEPYISERTMNFHYCRHHRGYVGKTNTAIAGTLYQDMPLVDIIQRTHGKPEKATIFNNAAQVFNHTFYWSSMKPNGGGKPAGQLYQRLTEAFGSYTQFHKAFSDAANTQFGSGWVWLVWDDTKLKIVKTSNADTPIASGLVPLLVIDVWEHAYYLDYQNRRADYVKAYLDHLVNWDFAEVKLKDAS